MLDRAPAHDYVDRYTAKAFRPPEAVRMKHLVVILVLAATTAGVRAADDASLSSADRDFFEKRIRPLLVERCFECHSTKSVKKRGGLLLDSRDSLLRGGDTGPAVVVGQPDKSLLLRAVRYQDEHLQMPPKGKLAERDLTALEEWVRRGV